MGCCVCYPFRIGRTPFFLSFSLSLSSGGGVGVGVSVQAKGSCSSIGSGISQQVRELISGDFADKLKQKKAMADNGSGGAGVDIDLYADVGEEFPQEELEQETNDLYDDVLASSNANANANAGGADGKAAETSSEGDKKTELESGSASAAAGSNSFPPSPRRFQLYVGGLTWWTTDQDIQDAIQSIGVSDFLEVKFYENRVNGQSKGFCCVSLASEASMRVVMEKLPKFELHQQTPAVTYATKQALLQFESQCKTRPVPQQQQQQPPPHRYPPPGSHNPVRGPLLRGGPPRGPPPTYSRPPPPSRPGLAPPPHHHHHHHHRGPPPSISVPPPSVSVSGPPLRHSGPPPGSSLPAPHVNPAFFSQGPPPTYPAPHGLSEPEFEEIMGRNRTVSSSAIARAVQDAANGEYASAIETLVTAISLIRQSKVASDDRCKILISSLQDTLHGVENKSYGRRDRSRSRERTRPSSSSRRPRSYSRERDYHHHHRSGDYHRERRHYEEYYRDRSRERERDYHHHHHHERDRYKREDHHESSSRAAIEGSSRETERH